jgi:anaerobic selenocysteine-containing dehydrogenase
VHCAICTVIPERVRRPLRRLAGSDRFAPVSWEEALNEAGAHLAAIQRQHGRNALLALYLGSPTVYSYTHTRMQIPTVGGRCAS